MSKTRRTSSCHQERSSSADGVPSGCKGAGSWLQAVRKAGFNASLVLEELYALDPAYGGNPQAAFSWWMSDPTSKADLLNSNTTAFGIAYVSSDKSLLGGYFVVVSAK